MTDFQRAIQFFATEHERRFSKFKHIVNWLLIEMAEIKLDNPVLLRVTFLFRVELIVTPLLVDATVSIFFTTEMILRFRTEKRYFYFLSPCSTN